MRAATVDGSTFVGSISTRFAHAVTLDVPSHMVSDDYISVAPDGRRLSQLWPVESKSPFHGTAQPLNSYSAADMEFAES